jgi:hypothetical protein
MVDAMVMHKKQVAPSCNHNILLAFAMWPRDDRTSSWVKNPAKLESPLWEAGSQSVTTKSRGGEGMGGRIKYVFLSLRAWEGGSNDTWNDMKWHEMINN